MLLLSFETPNGVRASVTSFDHDAPVLVIGEKTIVLKTHDGGQSYSDGMGFFYLSSEGVCGELSYICDTPVSFTPWKRV